VRALLALLLALVVTGSALAWTLEGASPRHTNVTTAGATPPYTFIWVTPALGLTHFRRILEHGATVAAGRVYATTLDGTTVAIASGSGDILWRRKLGANGLFATAPAYDRGRLYVNGRRPKMLWALGAASGKIIWRRNLGGNSEGGPLVVYHQVYVSVGIFGAGGSHVVKYTRYGGRRWAAPLRCSVTQSPTWTGKYIVIADRCGYVYAFTPGGRRAWLRRLPAPSGAHAAINAVYGRLYVHVKSNRVFALRPSNGRLLWARTTGVGTSYGGCAATRWRVWCANGWRDHRVSAWDRYGHRRWTRFIPGSQIMGDLVVTRGLLWVCSYSNRVIFGLDQRTGRIKLRVPGCAYTPAAAAAGTTYLVQRLRISALT
jgi:outer membrane protein assembly factor BamB